MLTLDWDVSRMTSMLTGISRATGASLSRVIQHEATKIFEGASRNTKAADRNKVITAAESEAITRHNNYSVGGAVGKNSRSAYPRISISSKKGKKWIKFQSGGKWYIIEGPGGTNGDWKGRSSPKGAKWSNGRWAKMQALEAERKAALRKAVPVMKKNRLRARGLAKRSWWMVARAAGLTFPVAAYVAKAEPALIPIVMSDFRARVIRGETSFAIEYENALPYITYIGGAGAINRAIIGRMKYFEATMRNATQDIFSDMAKRYGGLVTR